MNVNNLTSEVILLGSSEYILRPGQTLVVPDNIYSGNTKISNAIDGLLNNGSISVTNTQLNVPVRAMQTSLPVPTNEGDVLSVVNGVWEGRTPISDVANTDAGGQQPSGVDFTYSYVNEPDDPEDADLDILNDRRISANAAPRAVLPYFDYYNSNVSSDYRLVFDIYPTAVLDDNTAVAGWTSEDAIVVCDLGSAQVVDHILLWGLNSDTDGAHTPTGFQVRASNDDTFDVGVETVIEDFTDLTDQTAFDTIWLARLNIYNLAESKQYWEIVIHRRDDSLLLSEIAFIL